MSVFISRRPSPNPELVRDILPRVLAKLPAVPMRRAFQLHPAPCSAQRADAPNRSIVLSHASEH